MGACALLFSFGKKVSNSSNSGHSTSEQATSTVEEKENNTDLEEIKIGIQTWAAKNLDVSTFRNGDAIPEAKTNEEWAKAGENGKPAWCYYDNDPENGKKYGKLYNWYAVNDPRGLAPNGWHVPTDAEWTILTDYLGEDAGIKMKSTKGWNDYDGKTGNGTNESGFDGFPGGCRNDNGEFVNIGNYDAWWSSSEFDVGNARRISLKFMSDYVSRAAPGDKPCGFSVRCLRD